MCKKLNRAVPQTIKHAIGVFHWTIGFSANGFRWDPGGSWGVGLISPHGFCSGVARNQTAAVRTMPAAVGADVVVGEGGDDVPDRDRLSTPAAVPIDLGDGGRCGGRNSSSSSMNSVGS